MCALHLGRWACVCVYTLICVLCVCWGERGRCLKACILVFGKLWYCPYCWKEHFVLVFPCNHIWTNFTLRWRTRRCYTTFHTWGMISWTRTALSSKSCYATMMARSTAAATPTSFQMMSSSLWHSPWPSFTQTALRWKKMVRCWIKWPVFLCMRLHRKGTAPLIEWYICDNFLTVGCKRGSCRVSGYRL